MKLDISKVEFSKGDIRNNVKVPLRLTPELSYLIGIQTGDGYMNLYKRPNYKSIEYKLECSGHEIDELDLHKYYIIPIIGKLFNKKCGLYLGNKGTVRTQFNSKAILTFLNKVIGLSLSPKMNIDIPKIIKDSDIKTKKAFLKGLGDTEFCLTFKKRYREKHYYPVISFSTQSKNLQKSVLKILKELRFKTCHISEYPTYRKGKRNLINEINLNGLDNLNLWMKEVGFNSTKHITKYKIWKKYGFCPSKTNILERQKILKGEIDINSFYGAVA